MPRVKLKSLYATSNVMAHPGSTIDVSAEEAKQLIDGRFAELIGPGADDALDIETAESAPARETAAIRGPGRPRTK